MTRTGNGHKARPKPSTPARQPLARRARAAAAAQRETDPDSFATRHFNWPRWSRRATAAHALAAALGVPPEHVTITDDPDRAYGINGQYPGDRLRVTDPVSGHTWDFVPDHAAHGYGWLLLGTCTCQALVPVARIATLADLGAELEDPLHERPAECDGDPAHQTGCRYSRHTHRTPRSDPT